MYSALSYNFFPNDETAIETFDKFFDPKPTTKYGGFTRSSDNKLFYSSCFGSYGNKYIKGMDFYFLLASQTESIVKAAEGFNKRFKNIKFSIIEIKNLLEYPDMAYNRIFFTREQEESAIRIHNLNKVDMTPINIHMLKIVFDESYNELAKYCLRIPLGFFIRMFSTYLGSNYLNETNYKDPIDCAIKYANKNGNPGSWISDYYISNPVFYLMDDIELVNEVFTHPFESEYINGNHQSMNFGYQILPYCVYNSLNHADTKRKSNQNKIDK